MESMTFDRPSARLAGDGAHALSDRELVTTLLGRGTERIAETCADALLRRGLRHLATRSLRELQRDGGLDEAQAQRLAAAFALTSRLMGRPLERGAQFESPRQIYDHYGPVLRDRKREMFLVVLLDARHRVFWEEVVSEGSLTSSIVHPREVFMPAVRESAGAIVFVHNHPSGDPSPSEEDVAVTQRLVAASELLGIRVLDHIIVGDGTYASFKESGLL